MANQSKSLEVVKKQEMLPAEGSERTRECPCFLPRADIYETESEIVLLVDLPGVNTDSVEISLEKSILKINGYAEAHRPEGYSLAFAEYETGDYERSFRLSNEIDQANIEATLKDGVLRLRLHKAEAAKSRKIDVKAG